MASDAEANYRYNMTIKMFGVAPEPAFETVDEQEFVWGQRWGCDNDVGQIRVVLMHRPGDEMKIVDPDKTIEEIGAYGDPGTRLVLAKRHHSAAGGNAGAARCPGRRPSKRRAPRSSISTA